MLKPVIAATAMLAIAGSTFVYAQQGGYRGFRDGGPRLEHLQRKLLRPVALPEVDPGIAHDAQ